MKLTGAGGFTTAVLVNAQPDCFSAQPHLRRGCELGREYLPFALPGVHVLLITGYGLIEQALQFGVGLVEGTKKGYPDFSVGCGV